MRDRQRQHAVLALHRRELVDEAAHRLARGVEHADHAAIVGRHDGLGTPFDGAFHDVEQIVGVERIRCVKLLPSWDCYVMFYHPREFFVSQNYRARVFRKLEGNAPVLLIDGVAGGVWEQRRKSGLTEVRVQPFGHLSSAQKQLVKEEATGLGEFLGTNIEVSILS